jgi:superfamily II DNA or RNA helicase
LSLAPTYAHIFDQYPKAFHLGLTATPARGDGKGLGQLWDEIVPGATVSQLVDGGHLVPQRYYAPAKPDLAGIKIQAGDYVQGQLEHRMDTPKLVGDTVTNWLRIGERRQTVVFASGVKHSRHLRDMFLEAGVSAEHLDGKTPNDERAAILSRIGDGQTTVLCNCFVLTYGWDCPAVSCAVIARPTRSLILYLQMCGRVLRPAPHKKDALIIDHAGIIDEHGFLDEEFPWDLDGDQRIRERIESARAMGKKPTPVTCPACSMVFTKAAKCPRCGWAPREEPGDPVSVLDGDLHEVKRNGRRRAGSWTMADKIEFYGELKTIAARKGYRSGWAAHKYREKLGVWPHGSLKTAPLYEPQPSTLAWIRSLGAQYWRKKREMMA